jgi:excisionase family DNA binding protein
MIDSNLMHSAMINTRATAPEVIEGYWRSGGGIWICLTPGKRLIRRIRTGLHGNSSQVESCPGSNRILIKENRMGNNQELSQSENLFRPLLTVSEVALQLRISRSFAYLLVASGELPVIKIGKSRRVRLIDLEQFINSNRSGGNIR